MESAIIFIVVLLIPCICFSIISFVQAKYKDVNNFKSLSGFEVARKILDENGLNNMYIVEIKGDLNDHYDYKQKVIRLSSDVYHGETLTGAAVAARICSYALLDKDKSGFIQFKYTINPIITIGIYLAYIIFILSLVFQDSNMVTLAAILLVVGLVFNLIALPVMISSEKRAEAELERIAVLNNDEMEQAKSVLKVGILESIMNILTCVANLVREITYNVKRKG